MKPLRILRTVRHLKPSQMYGQVYYRLKRAFTKPYQSILSWEIPRDWAIGSSVPAASIPSPVPAQPATDIEGLRFRFLNQSHQLLDQTKWNVDEAPRLWNYNLHYFDWLWSLEPSNPEHWDSIKRLVTAWIDYHAPGPRATGWEPYPTSLRIINWCQRLAVVDEFHKDSHFSRQVCDSLWRQCTWLTGNLEFHIRANHFLENAVALCVAGAAMDGRSAKEFQTLGNRIARNELREQILKDGMHYERSPMYHARVRWLVEMLANWGDSQTRDLAIRLVPSMDRATSCMLHPHGGLALFNDSANGIYSIIPGECEDLAGSWALESAGYFGHRLGLNYFVCDSGLVGPDYQPGHAHADTFSFEWTVEGEPFITDTGVLEYTAGANREYDRCTSAHNTVQINDKNSSEVWSSFRVGRRCHPTVTKWHPESHGFLLKAHHNGFAGWVHERDFDYSPSRLVISDRVSGKGKCSASSFLHFAPNVEVEVSDGNILCSLKRSRVTIRLEGASPKIDMSTSRYSPEFGVNLPRTSIAFRRQVEGNDQWIMRFEVRPVQ